MSQVYKGLKFNIGEWESEAIHPYGINNWFCYSAKLAAHCQGLVSPELLLVGGWIKATTEDIEKLIPEASKIHKGDEFHRDGYLFTVDEVKPTSDKWVCYSAQLAEDDPNQTGGYIWLTTKELAECLNSGGTL